MTDYISADYGRCALVTIDMQNDFALPGAVAEIGGTSEVIPVISELLDLFRSRAAPVVHVIRLYKQDGSNVDACRKALIESGSQIALPGSVGSQLVDELKFERTALLDSELLLSGGLQTVSPTEWIVYKPRWGAFYNTHLEQFLRDKGINTLVFTGCNFPNCPRTSIYEASERDFRIVLIADAVSGIYEKGLTEMKNIGVSIMTADDLKHQFVE